MVGALNRLGYRYAMYMVVSSRPIVWLPLRNHVETRPSGWETVAHGYTTRCPASWRRSRP